MLKTLFVYALALGLSASAFAAVTAPTTTATGAVVPELTYSHDANYIYVRQPMRLTWDAEQMEALQQGRIRRWVERSCDSRASSFYARRQQTTGKSRKYVAVSLTCEPVACLTNELYALPQHVGTKEASISEGH